MVMKKTRSQKVPAARRGRVLPDDACPACETQMVEKRGTLRLPINGEEIAIASAVHLRCPKCGEVVLRFQDSKRLGEDAIAIYRKKHGLSPPTSSAPSESGSGSHRWTWLACCGSARTRSRAGSRVGTCRRQRWTCCSG